MNEIQPYQENISTQELLAQLWSAKYWMMACMLILTILALVYYVLATPLYKITMIVAPAETTETRFGGASLNSDNGMGQKFPLTAGMNVPLNFYNFTNIVTGPSVATILMQDQTVLDTLNQYNSSNIKTMEALSDFLSDKIAITPVGETPLKQLTLYYTDPDFGVALLRKIHLVADRIIQKEENKKAEKRIEYLRKNLREILNPDHRKALADLLMQQEHIFMLTNLDDAYAATVIEPPSHSANKHWPSLPLLVGVSLLGGMMIGYLIWWVRYSRCDNKVVGV